MNNNALYRYYDFNSNTIVRTKEKNSKLVLLTL